MREREREQEREPRNDTDQHACAAACPYCLFFFDVIRSLVDLGTARALQHLFELEHDASEREY